MSGTILWEHRDRGNGLWRPYGPIMTAELEQVYGTISPGSRSYVKYTCLGQMREVFVEGCKETVVGAADGQGEPNVRRVIAQATEWFWDDGQTWVRYEKAESQAMEKALTEGAESTMLSVGNWNYQVNFDVGMYSQRNTLSGTVRPVIRVDFSFLYGPSSFEVGVWEDVLEVRREDDHPVMTLSTLSVSDDEEELLVPGEHANETDSCVLCLDEFAGDKPAMRLRDCHGHYFHRHCDIHTNILHIVKLSGQCPVCSRSYRKAGHGEDDVLSPVTPSSSVQYYP